MQSSKVNENLTVSYQIQIEDIKTIFNMGFNTIICNRPDNEDIGQTDHETIFSAAQELGMKTIFQPIIGGTLCLANAVEFGKLIENQGKVFAYCRTGTRCITLWALSQRELGKDVSEIANICLNAGYDVRGALQAL